MLLENLFFLSLLTVVLSGTMRAFDLAHAGVPFAQVLDVAFMLQVALAAGSVWMFGFAIAAACRGDRGRRT